MILIKVKIYNKLTIKLNENTFLKIGQNANNFLNEIEAYTHESSRLKYFVIF